MKRAIRIIIGLLIALIIVGAIWKFIPRLGRGSTEESTAYTDLRLISEGDLKDLDDVAIVEGQVYFSLDYLLEEIDPDIYLDEAESTLIITNEDNVRRYEIDSLEGSVNDVLVHLRAPVTYMDDKLMVPLEAFAYDYDVDFRYIEDDNLVIMDRTDRDYIFGEIRDDVVWIREEPSGNSPIVRTLNTGEEVVVYEETNDWVKIRQVNGRAGWTQKSNVKYSNVFEDMELYREKQLKSQDEDLAKRDERINLAWDYTAIKNTGSEGLQDHVGVNVMSPTWFSLNEDMTISDRSNDDYTEFYQARGVEVWPMFDNNYRQDLSYDILSSSAKRQIVIEEIANLFKNKGYEGINIDFENLSVDTRDYFTQFVRELYPIFKEMDMVVSVDVVPRIYSDVSQESYDRKSLAEISDYIMLMAYDQHWATSPEAGSVAEYSWVEANMNVLFRDIPMEKFVLGLPLYTRIWTQDQGQVSSQSVSMQMANDYIRNNDMTLEWDENAKQYVTSKNIGGNSVSIWLEDSRSIRDKTSLAVKYDLAGVASWRVGFETPDIWQAIDSNL